MLGLPVVFAVTLKVLDGSSQPFFDRDARSPSGGEIEFCGGAIDVSDINCFFVGWKRDDAIRAAAGQVEQQFDELF